MIIYSIKLSECKTESDFEVFMLTEIFPSVDKNLTRDRITGLILLKGNTTSNEYLWLVHGGSSKSATKQQVERIEAFGAQVIPMQEFFEIGDWFAAHSHRICA